MSTYKKSNLAYDYNVDREQNRQLNIREVQINRTAMGMNPGYVVFFGIALVFTAVLLIFYLRLQSEFVTVKKQVYNMEKELNDLKISNDEAKKRIDSSINLENIRQIAVNELGMTYASEGQVVILQDQGSDYVRQMKSIDNME